MTTPYTGNGPDDLGFFGKFGGCYMPESLMPALQELEQAFNTVRHKPEFWAEYQQILTDFVGRPSPLFMQKPNSLCGRCSNISQARRFEPYGCA
jgi:tryptophan synthase beta chain